MRGGWYPTYARAPPGSPTGNSGNFYEIDDGTITVSVEPHPAQTNLIIVELHNGSSRAASYSGCQDLALERLAGSDWTKVLPPSDAVCSQERLAFPPDFYATERFALGGVSPGTYRVAFRPLVNGRATLYLSPTFDIR